ncbi:MAG: M23 family metallopeptidase [Bacilli bacterium]|nr:M23 family metallopeptidase [Bacilli bacterium]
MNKNKIYSFFNRLLITCVLTLGILIMSKKSELFKTKFYSNVYETNFNFAKINDIYKSYFGNAIPFSDFYKDKTELVFNEKLDYGEITPYLDGASLSVSNNYLVPSLDKGLVIFIGEKEGYGNTVIVQGINGVDIWYSNITNVNVNLYQYISKGSLIGNAENNLYLVFKKDGNVLDYKEYIH